MLVKTSPCGVLRLLSCMALGWAVHFAHAGTNDAGSSITKVVPADGRAAANSKPDRPDARDASRNGAGNHQQSDSRATSNADHRGRAPSNSAVAANPVKGHSDGQASKGDGARANGGSRSGDSKTVSHQGKAQSENRGAGTG